jgi:hypothetical protein
MTVALALLMICVHTDLCAHVHTATAVEHIEAVSKVLTTMLHSCGLRAHPQKSVFGAAVISYLGPGPMLCPLRGCPLRRPRSTL